MPDRLDIMTGMTHTTTTTTTELDAAEAELADAAKAKRRAPKGGSAKVTAKATKTMAAAPKRTAAKKAAPAKRTPAKKAAPAKRTAKVAAKPTAEQTDARTEAAVKRIAELRAEGVAWRPLSATLNDEGFLTIRGKSWSANGSTAFLLAKKHNIG